ncbi:hypothetical protein OHT76_22800 [Streptomyces sp. NBC_00287]|uniref:hypothetical protein n=1 Tax=Streptomyces sp. NBC_00287 TaxID=2975702 RepID=UPI002E2AC0CB|nr:hypothetical protein [Streptomyces sp. NBC_00287]
MGDGAKARQVYEDAVEYLCRNIDDLRGLVGPAVWEPAFAAVRDRDPASREWRDAVRALHDTVEAAGVPGGLGLDPTMGVGDWIGRPTPQSVGWICPTRRCGRVDLREEATDTPTCALHGLPMRLIDG